MVTKKELLKNLRNYSAEEIAEAVKAGVVTVYELKTQSQGAFTPLLSKKVNDILANPNYVPAQPVTDASSPVEPTPVPMSAPMPAPVAAPAQAPAYVQQESPVFVQSTVPPMPPVPPTPPMQQNAYQRQDVYEETGYESEKSSIWSFEGRIGRMSYFLTLLITNIINFALAGIAVSFVSNASSETTLGFIVILYILVCLPISFVCLAQGCKRCHDVGLSGWYQLIPLFYLYLLFAPGKDEENEYGAKP